MGSVNDALGVAGIGLGFVENSGSRFELGRLTIRSSSPFVGDYVVPGLRLTEGAHFLGMGLFFVSTGIEGYELGRGAVSPLEFGVDTAVGAVGLSGPTGFAFATIYFILKSAPPTPVPFIGEPCMEAQICGPPYSDNP